MKLERRFYDSYDIDAGRAGIWSTTAKSTVAVLASRAEQLNEVTATKCPEAWLRGKGAETDNRTRHARENAVLIEDETRALPRDCSPHRSLPFPNYRWWRPGATFDGRSQRHVKPSGFLALFVLAIRLNKIKGLRLLNWLNLPYLNGYTSSAERSKNTTSN